MPPTATGVVVCVQRQALAGWKAHEPEADGAPSTLAPVKALICTRRPTAGREPAVGAGDSGGRSPLTVLSQPSDEQSASFRPDACAQSALLTNTAHHD